MDGGAWWATVHGVAKSRTRLSDFAFAFISKLPVGSVLGFLIPHPRHRRDPRGEKNGKVT